MSHSNLQIYSNNATPLQLDACVKRFPTLAATKAHESRSDSYKLISTADAIETMQAQGLAVHSVQVAKVRDVTKRGFERHLVRMRPQYVSGPDSPEAVLINSHDGATSFAVFVGFFRGICENGLIFGDMFGALKVYHRGNALDQIAAGTVDVMGKFNDVAARIDAYKSRQLSMDEIRQFATLANELKYGPDAGLTNPIDIVTARRLDDCGNDLWRVYNAAQENIIRGGVRGAMKWRGGNTHTATRIRSMRAVNGVDSTLKLNRGLFDIADSFVNTGPIIQAARIADSHYAVAA